MMSFFLHDSYSLKDRELIIKDFKKVSYNTSLFVIRGIERRCTKYLMTENDVLIRDIHTICEGLVFLKNQQVQKAKQHVKQIWERLSKQDHLYYLEIILLKNILFLFDLDITEEMVKRSIKELEMYEALYETAELQVSVLVNYSYLLIRNEDIEKAMKVLQFGKELCASKKRPDLVCDIYFYKAICCYISRKKYLYNYYLKEVLQIICLVSNPEKVEEVMAELAIFVSSEEISKVKGKYEKLKKIQMKFEL